MAETLEEGGTGDDIALLSPVSQPTRSRLARAGD